MKIAFIDAIAFDYDIDYPLHSPLGAGNSAICYLAKELAKHGHEVTVFNGCRVETEAHNVRVRNMSRLDEPKHFLNTQDVAIVCSGAVGANLRNAGVNVPLILWTQHAHDQPGIAGLRNPQERYAWTGIAYVSDWQKRHYEAFFGMPPDRAKIIPNGVSPAFEELELARPWYLAGMSPVLFYTSTPFRGLQTLLSAFPAIRNAIPGTQLRVFSSMKVYQKRPEDDDFGCFYEMCRMMDGVEYIGSLGQQWLAAEVARCDALAYPSTFPEGLCVAMLEAMAVGAEIFTTTLGALPEATGGHAHMVDVTEGLTRRYAEMVIEGLRACERDPQAALLRRDRRLDYIRGNFLWHNIAAQWDEWLTKLSSTATATRKLAS
jgi:glycosyltransferase involved in cell wall biosynthesis